FLETVRQMLGDYGHTAKTETVLLSRDERSHTPRPDLLDLRGRRLVTASEVVEGKHFNEALVKSMTGGEELNARALYGATAVTFTPTHKLWLGVNHLPVIRGDDEGIWRRIRVIPFDVTIPAADRDPALPGILRDEWPGILAWAVQGCLAWRRERLGTPPSEVTQATTTYRADSDVLGGFLTERCTLEAGMRATGGALYGAYKGWAIESGFRPVSKNVFAGKLNAKGFIATKSHGTMVYHGIGLAAAAEPFDPAASSELFGGSR
ncbi:MAG TPA: phage/plasmid primase, P4 family, partial [Gemmatimonadales bacterium]|nr:phage/plasmid primase, P4 family [Gemmatimonadales bacterium]